MCILNLAISTDPVALDDDNDIDDDDNIDEAIGAGGIGVSGTAGDGIGGVPIGTGTGRIGVPDPYYPIALPIDQAFKAKYVFHHRRGKTFQERLYVFLEHPCGWICFVYHFTV